MEGCIHYAMKGRIKIFKKKSSASPVRFKSKGNKTEPKPVDDHAHRTWFSVGNKY
ncbi:hypothetical protein ECN1_2916 [Escherichia coli N1]|nr:hypothetical protein ECN1_2916 [Escherichia coli N1]